MFYRLKVLTTSGASPMRLLGATMLLETTMVQETGSVWTAVSKLHTITLSLDITCDGVRCEGMRCEGVKCEGVKCEGVRCEM